MVVKNHYGYGLRNDEKPFAHMIPKGGNWRDISVADQLVYWNGRIPTEGGSANGLKRLAWSSPAGTVTATPLQKLSCQLHPEFIETYSPLRPYSPYLLPRNPLNGLSAVSTFCGGGLMDLGVLAAGVKILWANDFNRHAVRSYLTNIGNHVIDYDINKVPLHTIPSADMLISGSPCFLAGQRIVTEKGLSPIETIKKGDYVLTHRGRYRKVVTPMVRSYSGSIYKIVPKDYRIPIHCTPEHPFYTKRGWVDAKDLRDDDYVAFPLNNNSKLPGQPEGVLNDLPFDNENFWKLVGYWFAQGSCVYGDILLVSLASDENPLLLDILDSFSVPYDLSETEFSQVIKFQWKDLEKFLKRFICQTDLKSRVIPEFVQDLPVTLARAFVDGIFVENEGFERKLSSTSIEWVESLQRLLLKTDKRLYSLGESDIALKGSSLRFYDLRVTSCQSSTVEFTEDYVFFKLSSIETYEVDNETVYNFEVEEDNSYCLPMVAVHNCQDYSVFGDGQGESGERGKLLWTFVNILEQKRYRAFLFENVRGIVTKDHKHTFDRFLAYLRKLGYHLTPVLVNSWDYGVPQIRERVLVFGIRKDLGFMFRAPKPDRSLFRTQNLETAIGDLPLPEYVHQSGQVLRDLRYNSDSEIKTSRRYTVREYMRIQTVPDDYVIPEDVPLAEQYRMIGNGVPPFLTYQMVSALSEQMLKALADPTTARRVYDTESKMAMITTNEAKESWKRFIAEQGSTPPALSSMIKETSKPRSKEQTLQAKLDTLDF